MAQKTNILGATFTILLLVGALIFVTWRAVTYQAELIACYKEQVKDAVTVIPPQSPND